MKPIFVATDYSDNARHASDFAAQLAKATNSELILFHSWTLPALAGDVPAMPVTYDDYEKAQKAAVSSEAERIFKKWGVKVKPLQAPGFASDEILACAEEIKPSLIVTGIHHAGRMGQIFGSVTTTIIRKSKFPVLVVPSDADYKKPEVVMLATDFRTAGDWFELNALKELATELHFGVHILNVTPEEHVATAEESKSGIRLDHRLSDLPHSWHFPADGDIVAGIEKCAAETGSDWLAVVPHSRSWTEGLFHASVTKRLAFESPMPLLVLPERYVHIRD